MFRGPPASGCDCLVVLSAGLGLSLQEDELPDRLVDDRLVGGHQGLGEFFGVEEGALFGLVVVRHPIDEDEMEVRPARRRHHQHAGELQVIGNLAEFGFRQPLEGRVELLHLSPRLLGRDALEVGHPEDGPRRMPLVGEIGVVRWPLGEEDLDCPACSPAQSDDLDSDHG